MLNNGAQTLSGQLQTLFTGTINWGLLALQNDVSKIKDQTQADFMRTNHFELLSSRRNSRMNK